MFLIEPQVLRDSRGFFLESYHAKKFAQLGIDDEFVQDNHSRSVANTVRGLHYQLKFAQTKLCRVIAGKVLDVVVDMRRGSPTFGKWEGFELSAENHRMIYVPKGFAHGFSVLSESAEFLYKCSDFYHAEDERGVLWNDPEIGIDWRVESPLLSAKDQRHPLLKEISSHDLPVYAGPGGRRGKLLSLGKHPPVLTLRNQMLESAGYEVETAKSIEEAKRVLKSKCFDAAIIGYTFSKKEKEILAKFIGEEIGIPAILLYLKPADLTIRTAAHVNAVHGEEALLGAVAAVLREHAKNTRKPGVPSSVDEAGSEIESV